MFQRYFPKGIAKKKQFFNRTDEIKRLIGDIHSCTHSVLVAPRRYGKSSLAKQAILEAGCLHCEVDLFVAVNDVDVGEKIIEAVSSIIQDLTDGAEKWFLSLRKFFIQADKKWTVGFRGVKLELIPHSNKTVPQNILDVLEALEYMLKQHKKTAVVYIDEFQEILKTDPGKAIEGAIRHFAQESEHVVFVFSGSNRKLLQKMFNDRSHPLYALCDEIHVDRIDAHYYETYLQYVAKQTFKKELPKKTIDRILQLSERHPRYVYLLCFEVWLRCGDKLPTEKDVTLAWHEYVLHKYKDVRAELTNRSRSQIKLLTEIATGHNAALSSAENQLRLGLTSSVIVQALKVLEEHDYIERTDKGGYRLIDPLIRSALLYAYSRKDAF
jgi:AAA+ ATPase superfamily predicted ATPase